MKKTTSQKLKAAGFTIMELLFVIAIGAIIISAIAPGMNGAKGKAENVKKDNTTKEVEQAKTRYSLDNAGVGGTDTTFALIAPYLNRKGTGTVTADLSLYADPAQNGVGLPITSWGKFPDSNGQNGTVVVWGTYGATPVSN